MTNVQATFAATLVDEWARCGVRHAVVAPGSRSTPLALALAADERLQVHVHHDERAAGFTGLGIGKASGVPAVVLTTSGTAAAELHPAVIEAHQARVPLLVCTADRPPELQSVGAPQTIDQTHLFGRAVRWFAEPGVPDDAGRATWRSLAARAYLEAAGVPPGPVHLNLAFRDPLVGEAGAVPEGRSDGDPWHRSVRLRSMGSDVVVAPAAMRRSRGVIVAGAGSPSATCLLELSAATGWPVLADPLSGGRALGAPAVAAFDAILRDATFAESVRPDAVVRFGDAPASRVLAQWLAASDARQVAVHGDGAWIDADRTAALHVDGDPDSIARALASELDGLAEPAWTDRWITADAVAQTAIDDVLGARIELTEPFVARAVASHASGTLVVSSSMPVRDLEWYAAPGMRAHVHANRGANGIDGVVSTAVGVAVATGAPVTALVGDVALLHDANALLGLAERGLDLTVVVVDNRGGGIFSFLPQAGALAKDRFEQLFGTPHSVDLAGLAAVHGIPALRVYEPEGLAGALEVASASAGAHVVIAPTDRASNVAVHDDVHAAVTAALRSRG